MKLKEEKMCLSLLKGTLRFLDKQPDNGLHDYGKFILNREKEELESKINQLEMELS